MDVSVGNTDYELSTTLGTARALETKFKMPLGQIFQRIEQADLSELIDVLCVAAANNKQLGADILEHWDYTDLQIAVQELLLGIMFSGTDENKEQKIAKLPVSEMEKNAMREMLGLPTMIKA